MWHAITDPETSRCCWSAIGDIERALADAPGDDQDPRLATGKAGEALFFAYLHAAVQQEDAADRALDAVDRSIDALAASHLQPSLYGGFSGIGWAVEHLSHDMFEADDDVAAAVDEALAVELREGIRHFELVNGLAGFGVYLVERLPDPVAAALLERVVDRLAESAEESEVGVTWFTRPEWLPASHLELMPEGCYNLGVAHGVPGVLGFLASAWSSGSHDPRIPRLAEGVVRWLLGRRLPPQAGSIFPSSLIAGRGPEPARTAWCYGDPGVAAVLLWAARSFSRPDWEEEALSIARLAARRSLADARVVDAGLCHGAAGLAHLFNRLHQATGDPELREAALTWYGRALDMRQPGEGLAGFLSFVGSPAPAGNWQRTPGFLTGIAGIGLALLAAVTGVEPAWDRVMLLSVPAGSHHSIRKSM